MPKFILHRVNKISQLEQIVDPSVGFEIDIRTLGGKLVLNHDPFFEGDLFESWLRSYSASLSSGTLVLNTKEDGLEKSIIEILEEFGIENYAFLDTTIPSLVKWCLEGKSKKFFVRYSKYEPIEAVLQFKGSCDWVWADCFDLEPLAPESLLYLSQYFRVCLVSPELQGGTPKDFARFAPLASCVDSICTKFPLDWKKVLSTSSEPE